MSNILRIPCILSGSAMILSILTLCIFPLRDTPLATVDMKEVISTQAVELGKQYPDGQISPQVMQHLITEIKEQMNDIAKAKHVTLITKGVVLSENLPDYTETVKEALSKVFQVNIDQEANMEQEQGEGI